MADVKLNGLVKKFGEVTALNNVSFEVHDKEFVTLLGPTGAGKTTTLRSIVGLEKPDAGEIVMDGQVINTFSPGERDMAFVSQHYALYPQMTVYKNLEFPLNKTKMTAAQKKEDITRIAHILHIENLLERRPDKLSGGEMQRVVIGRAMVRSPKIFLLDEPLSNLDAKLREELRFEIKRLQKEHGATTLYVTHDQVEALSMSDRVVVLHKGVVQQIGTPMEIYSWPANTRVSGFVGSPGMNLVPGEIVDGKFAFDGTGLSLNVPAAYQKVLGKGACTLGIRPEDVKVAASDKAGTLKAEVYIVESLGYENLVDFQIGKNKLRARVSGRSNIKVGDLLPIALEESKVRFFDKDGNLVKV